MSGQNIHITGASCSGVSSLGYALAKRFAVPQIDVDDFYWMPTDPPFTTKRPPEDRVRLIEDRQHETAEWILTGSCLGWGDSLIRAVDLIVFIYTPTVTRLQRLDQREAARYGKRILPDGDMHEAHLAFRDWASLYEEPTCPGRNLAKHEHWLSEQSVPVLRLDGMKTTRDLVHSVEEKLSRFSRVNSRG